ncbi:MULTISPECIES: outer membrane lipid asymmetry maintenance protein MlaD [Aquitalea]|jgi:phospholipid/cholesterol/gamma-HCH transport system substrate-binding protein|uniref:Phospholipid/cholesterol/gamma-HCH transport system substrate-binding protein n=1 Tax=Aquitalea magnusonii TaxID=332411 RepID=A0A318IZM5_9NEIS|nr:MULTISPECIES: outer membrane lipid asymmetry maintenance protein MlaD [Aquitalea]PXX39841.1 phospholipid/cholesterol/gamma-HCH transport system substrate-binding protein [Aquitalea magnusonii]
MKRSTIDLWVGLFVALGIAAVVFMSLKVANLTPQSADQTYTLYADFDNIGGLKVKAPVKEAGVVVGRVGAIQLDTKTYRARVTLNLDKQYTFSRDASAEILTAGLLGEQYIGLLQGGDPDVLKAGEHITLTSSALVLEQLIGKFMTSFSGGNSAKSNASAAQ